MLKGAIEAGFPHERAIESKSQRHMSEQMNDVIERGDLVLLKGSRMMGLEKVVQALREMRKKDEHYDEKVKGNNVC
jgi:UDP-N-acetylmuramyl pentapeptide synthase